MEPLIPLPGEVVAQHIRCGKAGCRCREGHLHGPYYYRMWREGDKVRKFYVPVPEVQTVQAQCAAYKAIQARLRQIRQQREQLTQGIKRQWRSTKRILRAQ